ncbi:hypothetical protein BJY52DRAFT_1258438 [Lactarius psammicola]|nr:hypothetical protein BJY52DRAFT_1258438 [Lactarius psammicola]
MAQPSTCQHQDNGSALMAAGHAKIYLANRFAGIACAVSFLVGYNITSGPGIDCQSWIIVTNTFPMIEFELALTLIVIRVVAIWKCTNMIISLTAAALSAHLGVSLYLLAGIRSFWDPGPNYHGCVTSAPRTRLLMLSVASIAIYAFLLIAMLVGLLRHRPARSFRLWNLLLQQGWIWFALAVVAEVPLLTLVILNINPSYNLLLQKPRVVIASIGTTTMFRVLSRYNRPANRGEQVVDIIRLRGDSNYLSSQATPTSPPPSAQLKVSVHTTTTGFSDIESTQKPEY